MAVVLSVLLVVGTGAVAAGAVTAVSLARDHCDLDVLRPIGIGQNTFVYAADGTSLGSIPAERNRQPVALVDISPWMRRAAIAVEDRRFYRHSGVDYEGIARALWRDLTEGEIVEGGSTLTQQLVRNLYISRERTVTRKLREACLAVQLNRDWSKQRILRAWLNIVYFGNRAYGVEAAAQTYFSKPARTSTSARRRCWPGCRRRRPRTTRSPTRPRPSRGGISCSGDARQRGHHPPSTGGP